MSNYLLIIIILLYLALLFYIAYWAEKNSKSKWVNNPYVYTLSLAVYCTAWTYYGSVGIAAKSGFTFLPIYLGPVVAFPLWVVLMRKIIRITKQQKISSIADFISLRYGNNRFLGGLVTVIAGIATIPYISLQLKAVSETFQIMSNKSHDISTTIFNDSTLYIAVILAVFATFYGTQKTDASEKHKGIVASTAFESILKLVFFLLVGGYVTFYLFDGTTDIYEQMKLTPNFSDLIVFGGVEDGFNWLFMISLSFMAIFLLPRQFLMSVVENVKERHLKQAIWLFPLYLLVFNFFVIYIAWGGTLTFGNTTNAEYFALLLPLNEGNILLSLLVFLGGFSAVISMVVVSTLALSTMVSNNLIIPYGFLNKFVSNQPEKNAKYIKAIRRVSIFLIIMLAYTFYASFSVNHTLFSIGLVSFVVISQLGPSFFLGLFWKRGSATASIIGIILGFLVTVYTLILPFILEAYSSSSSFTDEGLMGIAALKPYALFGIDFLSPPAHAFFWSMMANSSAYLLFSVSVKGNYRERNYAEMFIDNQNYTSLQDNALVWKGEAFVEDIRNVLNKFLGTIRTNRALDLFFRKYDIPKDTQMADARLINFSEKLLTGSIGSASAKILIAKVVKEEKVSLVEVLEILEESKNTIANNKKLLEKSTELTQLTNQLKEANHELILKDQQKDEFLDTVAHELKTPITGIRAATELLLDDEDDMPSEIKSQFLENILNDSERLSRLIHNILDFEKLATDRHSLNFNSFNLMNTLHKAVNGVRQIAANKDILITIKENDDIQFNYDEDRILQVLTNLLSNAIKFCEPKTGQIMISFRMVNQEVMICVEDNGKGVPEEDLEFIFDKFYQSQHQNTIKPEGSGLGLAISKRIIENHGGKIWAESKNNSGATFVFHLPYH
tara:strand:+ start:35763 stop:38453 length:2691 start_codon:yes stop_codon:yes gene_type:complete